MKIGEVAIKAGVTNRAIRHYEELNLIKSRRLSNNYREYSKEALDKVKFISRARKLGFSIDECSSLFSLFLLISASSLRHFWFNSSSWDLGIYDQAIYLISQGFCFSGFSLVTTHSNLFNLSLFNTILEIYK